MLLVRIRKAMALISFAAGPAVMLSFQIPANVAVRTAKTTTATAAPAATTNINTRTRPKTDRRGSGPTGGISGVPSGLDEWAAATASTVIASAFTRTPRG